MPIPTDRRRIWWRACADSSDLAETDYSGVAQAFGCAGIRVEIPDQLAAVLPRVLATSRPVVVAMVVTRDPAKMLPGVDDRAAQARRGDRVA